MSKKSGTVMLVAVIALQLLFSVRTAYLRDANAREAKKHGTLYSFEIESLSYSTNSDLSYTVECSKLFSGYVHRYNGTAYVAVSEGEEGFADMVQCFGAPEGSSYIDIDEHGNFSFPANSIDVGIISGFSNAFFVKENSYYSDNPNNIVFKSAWLEAYVYNGKVFPVEVYIDSVTAREYITQLSHTR